MGIEIERSFLVEGRRWRAEIVDSEELEQGYLAGGEVTVRVRVRGDVARLTVKGPAKGLVRPEYEYPIPRRDAREMIDELCGGHVVRKTRHTVEVGGHEWVIDEFAGANAGLVLAEIELESADEDFERPRWLGQEVSDDLRYRNARLARRPWSQWDE
jgi:adenylate cyclase